MGNVTVIEKDGAAVRVVKATDHVQQCRLPGPIRPNNRDNFAAPDLQTYLANSPDATEIFRNVLDPEFSLCRHARAALHTRYDPCQALLARPRMGDNNDLGQAV